MNARLSRASHKMCFTLPKTQWRSRHAGALSNIRCRNGQKPKRNGRRDTRNTSESWPIATSLTIHPRNSFSTSARLSGFSIWANKILESPRERIIAPSPLQHQLNSSSAFCFGPRNSSATNATQCQHEICEAFLLAGSDAYKKQGGKFVKRALARLITKPSAD